MGAIFVPVRNGSPREADISVPGSRESLKDDIRNAGKLELSSLKETWLSRLRTGLVLVN